MKLVIVTVLALSVIFALEIRTNMLEHGMELDEFDPFYNYRASLYLYENGHKSYQKWIDELSWAEHGGRDVTETSQTTLHYFTAITYIPFEDYISFKDYTIILPAILGSLTVVPVFLLTRTITHRYEIGLIAGFLFAMTPTIISRASVGWFKSEPLGMFLGIFALWLIVSGIQRSSLPKLIIGGIVFGTALASWGGVIFFFVPLVLWLFVIKENSNKLQFGLASFIGSFYFTTFLFPRAYVLANDFIAPALVVAVIFLMIKSKSKKIAYIFIVGLVVAGTVLVVSGEVELTNSRYLSALNPLGSDVDLHNSVMEHQQNNLMHFVFVNGVLLFLGIVGILVAIWYRMNWFILILAGTSIFIGMNMMRLELFSSLALVVLSAITIWKIYEILLVKKNTRIIGIVVLGVVVLGLFVLYELAEDVSSRSQIINMDNGIWVEALTWVKNNTPEDSKIMAWWDYGYWIQTVGERATYIDNSAKIPMENYANMLTDEPQSGIDRLNELGVDYVIVFVRGIDHGDKIELGIGGDYGKLEWIAKIGNRNPDNITMTNSLYTFMMPFDDNFVRDQSKIDTLNNMGAELVYQVSSHEEQFATIYLYKLN